MLINHWRIIHLVAGCTISTPCRQLTVVIYWRHVAVNWPIYHTQIGHIRIYSVYRGLNSTCYLTDECSPNALWHIIPTIKLFAAQHFEMPGAQSFYIVVFQCLRKMCKRRYSILLYSQYLVQPHFALSGQIVWGMPQIDILICKHYGMVTFVLCSS